MTALAGLSGVTVGLGIVLVVAGGLGIRSPWHRPGAGVRWTPHLLPLAAALGVAALVGAVTGWPVGALLAAAGTLAARRLFTRRASLVVQLEALAVWTEMLRDMMAGAAGIEGAIRAATSAAPAALRPHAETLASRLDRGQRLEEALDAFADDVNDPVADLIVAALKSAATRQSGRLGELLGALAEAIRAEVAMRLRVEAERAQTRTSVRIIVGASVGWLLVLTLVSRHYFAPFGTPTGQVVLLVIGGCFAYGFVLLDRFARPVRAQRFLREPAGGA